MVMMTFFSIVNLDIDGDLHNTTANLMFLFGLHSAFN